MTEDSSGHRMPEESFRGLLGSNLVGTATTTKAKTATKATRKAAWEARKLSVLEAVKRNGLALRRYDRKLRADKEIVLAAVKEDGRALLWASKKLQSDKDVVLEAVKQPAHTKFALQWASEEVRMDRDVVLAALSLGEVVQGLAGEALFADKDVMLEVVTRNGLALQWACEELRADKEIVLEAVKQHGCALEWASKELRADGELVLEAVKRNGCALEWASEELRADAELVLEGVRKSGTEALQWASEKCQTDKELLLLAIRFPGLMAVFNLTSAAQAMREGRDFERVDRSAIAVRGEDAPVLTVRLSHIPNPGSSDESQNNEQTTAQASSPTHPAQAIFRCEASLMSGTSLDCSIPDVPGDSHRDKLRRRLLGETKTSSSSRLDRPGPIVNDMAKILVGKLPEHARVSTRVFINFVINEEEGFVLPVSPWDWERQLKDFLPLPSGQGAAVAGHGGISPRTAEQRSVVEARISARVAQSVLRHRLRRRQSEASP